MSKLNEITGKGNLPRLAAGIVMMFAAMTVTLGLSVATVHADGIIKLAASTKTRSIKVPLAKPTTFRTDAPFNEIVVGDPDLAIVTPLTDQSFYIVGSRKGITGIALFNEERELIGSLDVEIGPDENQINEDLRAVLGESGVKASTKTAMSSFPARQTRPKRPKRHARSPENSTRMPSTPSRFSPPRRSSWQSVSSRPSATRPRNSALACAAARAASMPIPAAM